MEEKTWTMALWNRSWNAFDDPKEKKYTVQGACRFSPSEGALLEIPYGDISMTRELQETGCYKERTELITYKHLYGSTQDGFQLVLSDVYQIGSGKSFPGGTYENLRANTVLSSKCQFDPDAPIVAADFVIEGIREWLGFIGIIRKSKVMWTR